MLPGRGGPPAAEYDGDESPSGGRRLRPGRRPVGDGRCWSWPRRSRGDGRRSAPGRQAAAEGAVLATYRFVDHKSEDEGGQVDRLVVLGLGWTRPPAAGAPDRGAPDRPGRPSGPGPGERAAELDDADPSRRDRRAARFADVADCTLEVWDEQRIADERLGGLLGVARGSAEPPRLIRVAYGPTDPVEVDGRVPHVVLVGKGITFDSGGLSLKTAGGMETMKTDMSGAAVVLAALVPPQRLGVRIRVTALAPVTENMPGGPATKPGDVLTIRNGKTIEVLNTDAEGRLVLADGLSLAAELEPDAIIDLATLTGACVVALGEGDRRAARQRRRPHRRRCGGRGPGRASRPGPCPCPTTTEAHRLGGGRHEEHGQAGPGRRHRGRPAPGAFVGACRGSTSTSPVRPGPTAQRVPDQGGHRFRREDAGGAGHLGGVRRRPGTSRPPGSRPGRRSDRCIRWSVACGTVHQVKYPPYSERVRGVPPWPRWWLPGTTPCCGPGIPMWPKAINVEHANAAYLPGFGLPPGALGHLDVLDQAVCDADLLVVGVPTSGFRQVLEEASACVRPWVPVVSLSKGLENAAPTCA